MDHFKIRTKLLIIFVICVLLPVIVTDTFFIYSVTKNVKQQEYNTMEDMLDQMTNELERKIQNVVSISDYLYMNEKLNRFIEDTYDSHAAYYDAFNQFLEDNVIRYYYTAESISNVLICAENDTLINGSYFTQINAVEDSVWYKEYKKNGERMILFAYYEEDPYETSLNRARHISLIRKLDNFGGNAVMKMDLDYDSLQNVLEIVTPEMEVCVDNGTYMILGKHIPGDGDGAFLRVEDYEPKSQVLSGDMDALSDLWNIRISMEPYGFTKGLEEETRFLFLLIFINLIVPTVLLVIVNRSFKRRILQTESYMNQVEEGVYEEIPGDAGKDEIGDMIRSYNVMALKIKELIEVVYKKEAEKKDMILARNRAELDALKRQINPHFMYNTLESIRMHSLVKNEKETADLMRKFSNLLRRVSKWSSDFVPVTEEAESVMYYLDIQKSRFGQRLVYSVYVQEEAKQLMIPKFVVMTFVENACVHGIEPCVEGGSITVTITADEDFVYIEVMDTGAGMEEQILQEIRSFMKDSSADALSAVNHIGILNTLIRLKLYFPENLEFEIDSTIGEGTELFVKLPRKGGLEYVEGHVSR